MKKLTTSMSYNQLWTVMLLITIVMPPLEFFGVKVNYISSALLSFVVIFLIFLNKIRLTPFELTYFIFFLTYIQFLFIYGSKNLGISNLHGVHLIGIFLIPVLLRRNIEAQWLLFNGILWYTLFNCVCIILFKIYAPSFLPVWITKNGYAFLYQPYLFAIFVGFSASLLINKKTVFSRILLVILVYFLIHSNSRILTLLFIILLLYISSLRTKLLVIPPTIALSVVAPPLKLLTVLGFSAAPSDFLSSDGSLLMRMTMFDNFVEWLDWNRLLFGGGYRAFEEFSFPYGVPGPTDVLYIRMISEIGIVGTITVLFGFIYLAARNYSAPLPFIVMTLTVLFFGVAQESWYTASAGHVISIMYVGFGSFLSNTHGDFRRERM